jgi:hypothetical protein
VIVDAELDGIDREIAIEHMEAARERFPYQLHLLKLKAVSLLCTNTEGKKKTAPGGAVPD